MMHLLREVCTQRHDPYPGHARDKQVCGAQGVCPLQFNRYTGQEGRKRPLGPDLHSFMPVSHSFHVPTLESILIHLWLHKARERK